MALVTSSFQTHSLQFDSEVLFQRVRIPQSFWPCCGEHTIKAECFFSLTIPLRHPGKRRLGHFLPVIMFQHPAKNVFILFAVLAVSSKDGVVNRLHGS